MKRKEIIHLLEKYSPTESEEVNFKEKMICFIKKHPECFERTLEIGHMTASSWLLDATGTKALLLHHSKLNIWCQPGGHCDGNSDVLFSAMKEAKEESGIEDILPVQKEIFDIDIHLIPAKGSTPSHFHYDVRFLLQIQDPVKEPIINEESKDFLWINSSPESLPTQERSIVRMWKKWINK